MESVLRMRRSSVPEISSERPSSIHRLRLPVTSMYRGGRLCRQGPGQAGRRVGPPAARWAGTGLGETQAVLLTYADGVDDRRSFHGAGHAILGVTGVRCIGGRVRVIYAADP